MDPISLGLSGLSLGSSLLGAFGGSQQKKVNPMLGYLSLFTSMQENNLYRKQMNLDATRRKRDIIRQAQIFQARSENNAANQGALFSSAVEGARGTISGTAGVQTLGVSQNQEIGNSLYDLANQKALLETQINQQSGSKNSTLAKIGSLSGIFGSDEAQRLGQYGYGKFTSI